MTNYQSTEECFNDIYERFLDYEDRNRFAEIFGISQETLYRWSRGFNATGERLVRLRVALELFGYTVSEWAAFDRNLYPLAEAIAYNVLTASDIAEELCYPTTSKILQVILSNTTMTKDRYQKALRLAEKASSGVDEKRKTAIDAISKVRLANFYIDIPESHLEEASLGFWASAEQIYPEITVQEKILMFDNLVKALLPLARYFDCSPAEDRKVLRKAVGYEEIAEVTELLRGLSSEKYRESR